MSKRAATNRGVCRLPRMSIPATVKVNPERKVLHGVTRRTLPPNRNSTDSRTVKGRDSRETSEAHDQTTETENRTLSGWRNPADSAALRTQECAHPSARLRGSMRASFPGVKSEAPLQEIQRTLSPTRRARRSDAPRHSWRCSSTGPGFPKGEFRVCSGAVPAFEGGVRQFRGCKTMNSIDAFSESRLPGTWTRWN